MNRYSQDHRWHERKNSRTWRPPKLTRSKRPILLAIFCVLLIGLWHFHTESINDSKQDFIQKNPNPFAHDRRSVRGNQEVDEIPSKEEIDQEPVHLVDAIKHNNGDTNNAQDNDEVEEDGLRGSHNGALNRKKHDELFNKKLSDDSKIVPNEKPAGAARDANSEQQPLLANLEQLPKGPVAVQADLDPDTQKIPLISSPDQPAKEKVIEAEPEDHLSLEEKADSLPEVVHITFEDAVKNDVLIGWEDEWIAHGSYDSSKWGNLEEPKIDFVYLWVNGSEEAFQTTKRPYEMNSVLNDPEGKWIGSHGVNRYRDWDELRYSLRSIEQHASHFRNKIQILVNSVQGTEHKKQIPQWLNDHPSTKKTVQVLAQEDFFDDDKHVCLPTFNSLTIENQLFNTPSDTDYLYALSDDMLLGKTHAASDIYSPLFGSVMGFKTNSYSTTAPPTELDAHRFGEKPFLIYTSWLLNRRFGIRKRKGQGHFGHSLSRSIMREAISSFPGPELQSACKRFRGEPGFQLYSWYVTFHYLIERHREALLWSYIMLRNDVDSDGNLSWEERQGIMQDLEAGMKNEGKTTFRKRNYYHVAQLLQKAGLDPPKVNTDIQWTSLDGPQAIRDADCIEFDVNECLAPGFSVSSTDSNNQNPIFSTAVVFDRLARQNPKCGDCLLKLVLNKTPRGLSPLLPHSKSQASKREIVVKAVMRYRYTIINPDALFVMVTDAEQVDSTLVSRFVRSKKELSGQLCLNDDVATEDPQELADVKEAMTELYEGLFPKKSSFEK